MGCLIVFVAWGDRAAIGGETKSTSDNLPAVKMGKSMQKLLQQNKDEQERSYDPYQDPNTAAMEGTRGLGKALTIMHESEESLRQDPSVSRQTIHDSYFVTVMIHSDQQKNPEAFANTSKAALELIERADMARSYNRYSEANDLYTRAIQASPQSAIIRYYRALFFGRQRKYSEQLIDAEAAVKIDPKLTPAWHMVSGCHFWLGQYEQGIAACNKILALDPDDLGALQDKSLGHRKLGKQED
jgi:tetratricopeptide (TPR) repeat protein